MNVYHDLSNIWVNLDEEIFEKSLNLCEERRRQLGVDGKSLLRLGSQVPAAGNFHHSQDYNAHRYKKTRPATAKRRGIAKRAENLGIVCLFPTNLNTMKPMYVSSYKNIESNKIGIQINLKNMRLHALYFGVNCTLLL